MRRFVHPLALLLLLAVGATALPRDDADAKAIDKLIEQLGDDHMAKRQDAAKRLEAIGEPAVEALRKAAKSHADPDVRLRAGVVAAAIDKKMFGEIRRFEGHEGVVWDVAFS